MNIYLGNLSVKQIEERTGITFSDKDREYMNEHRQEKVNDTPIKSGCWHCFDMPFMLMVSDKSTAEKFIEILSAYDWSKCKEGLQIGWER